MFDVLQELLELSDTYSGLKWCNCDAILFALIGNRICCDRCTLQMLGCVLLLLPRDTVKVVYVVE